MRNIDPKTLPFSTSNAILAYCLHMAGVPWDNPHHSCRVYYSKELLNKFTNGQGEPAYRGWELEKAVEHAHKHGKRGHVEYFFQRTPRLDILLKTFTEQVKELKEKDGYAHELIAEIVEQMTDHLTDTGMMRLMCVLLTLRKQFMDMWEAQVPIVIVANKGKVTRRGAKDDYEISSPGFRMVSLNASKETREHLGL